MTHQEELKAIKVAGLLGGGAFFVLNIFTGLFPGGATGGGLGFLIFAGAASFVVYYIKNASRFGKCVFIASIVLAVFFALHSYIPLPDNLTLEPIVKAVYLGMYLCAVLLAVSSLIIGIQRGSLLLGVVGLLFPPIGFLLVCFLPEKGGVTRLSSRSQSDNSQREATPVIGATDAIAPDPGVLQSTCEKCGNTGFDYDSYYKEYSCRNCGWQPTKIAR